MVWRNTITWIQTVRQPHTPSRMLGSNQLASSLSHKCHAELVSETLRHPCICHAPVCVREVFGDASASLSRIPVCVCHTTHALISAMHIHWPSCYASFMHSWCIMVWIWYAFRMHSCMDTLCIHVSAMPEVCILPCMLLCICQASVCIHTCILDTSSPDILHLVCIRNGLEIHYMVGE